MRPFTPVLFTFLALLSSGIVSGAAQERRGDVNLDNPRGDCLNSRQAQALVDRWVGFNEQITDGGAELRKSITDDIKYFSESLNMVSGFPVCICVFLYPLLCRFIKKEGKGKEKEKGLFATTFPIPRSPPNLLI